MHSITTPCTTSRPLTPLQGAKRAGAWAALALASTALLAGCSIFNFGGEPQTTTVAEPVQVAPAAPASAPAPAPVVVLEPSPVSAQPVAPQGELNATPLPETAPVVAAPAPVQVAPARVSAAAPLHTMAPSELAPGFYINVGMFAVPTNGTAAYKKLENANLPVFADGVRRDNGTLTRVRVGPYPTRAKAQAAVKKIRALKLDAVVFRHR